MKLLALGFVVVALAGCGDDGRSAGTSTGGGVAAPPYGTCTVGATAADVRVTVKGFGAERVCDRLIRAYAEQGDVWRRQPVDSSLAVVCELAAPNDAGSVTVRDKGSAFYGERVCAGYVAEGWRDSSG